jgi:diguanylate cyclase (GGDEF)-like protein/PAS domain S-box-containing protein
MKTKTDITILYVEDEPSIQKQLSRFISRFCTTLLTASNGAEALEIYKEHGAEIIITDIRMPVMNGIEMAKKIKELNPKQLLIFVSAHSESDFLFEAINMQADGYILKPVDLSILGDKLHKLIQIYENQQAAKKLTESEERFRKIANNSQFGIFIYKETFTYVNEAFCQLTGYTQEELYSMQPWKILIPSLQEQFKEIAKRRFAGEEFHKEYNDLKIITKHNEEKFFRLSGSTIFIDGGYAGLGTIIDITDIIKTQERLTLFGQAIEQMDEMVKITDVEGVIVYVNKAVVQHTLYTKEEILGNTNAIFKSGKHHEECYTKLWSTILNKEVFHDTFINKKKNGELYYEDQTITPLIDEKTQEIKYFISTCKDITKEIQMSKELKKLATRDALTGIYNRYRINQLIEDELTRAQRYFETFALIMFDIDHFKHINDTYGHDVGDSVLRELSTLVLSQIRKSDKFGRWGGEEFMILASKITKDDAINLAEKIRHRVDSFQFQKVGHISISIGVVVFHKNETLTHLLKTVDEALYEAKHAGRNCVVFKDAP